ncbi:MAG: hypothetical protein J0H74_24860 [Chitinophagaceae bacterium]|nr:hypothetical protein [Chitinophagaceae bacterium]
MWSSRQRTLEKLRSRWGKPRQAPFYPAITAYAESRARRHWHRLSPQTLSDIDIRDLFLHIDHTSSRIGQQYLYDQLISPTDNTASLKKLDDQAGYFLNNRDQREKAQLLLTRLDSPDAIYVQLLLQDKLFTRPKWYRLAVLDTFIVVVWLLLSFFYPGLLTGLMLLMAVNLFSHYRNKNNTYRFIRSFPQLNLLLDVTNKLISLGLPFDPTQAKAGASRLKTFQRRSAWLSFGETSGNDLALVYYWLLELLKALFLVEVHVFFALIRDLEKKRADIDTVFRYTASVDVAISVASLRAGNLPTCTPEFTTKGLHVKDGYHPLIPDCIPNSLTIDAKGILITGSNMSGKTTFLRSIGINTLLAQTIYTCFAATYQAPPLKLYSSIRIDDSVLEGKSYYFEEVNVMGALIAAAQTVGSTNLYLLDEVFKGTNTVERIAAAGAILSWLRKKGHFVIVSTHDIELSGLLKEEYNLYHFEETILDDQLTFDHLLKPGPLKTRNAIRILELAGYPEEITREARQAADIPFTPPPDGQGYPATAP